MTTSRQYQQMINPSDQHSFTLQASLNAFYPLSQLAKANREMFSLYCINGSKVRPLYAVEDYLRKYEVSDAGLIMGHSMRTLLLKSANSNQQKPLLMGGIGQAYLDVCLAVSVADYCLEDMGNPIGFSEYLSVCIDAINICFDNIDPFVALSKLNVHGNISDILKSPVEMAKDKERSKQIALNRVNSAFKILKLWFDGSLKYDVEYDQIIQEIDVCIRKEEDSIFFSHVVTVLRNKSSFTETEISFIDEAYENRFTADQQKALLSNVPKVTPSVKDTQAYFFKSTEKKTTSVFDVDLGAIAE